MMSYGSRFCDSDRSLVPRAEIIDGSRTLNVCAFCIEISFISLDHWCASCYLNHLHFRG